MTVLLLADAAGTWFELELDNEGIPLMGWRVWPQWCELTDEEMANLITLYQAGALKVVS